MQHCIGLKKRKVSMNDNAPLHCNGGKDTVACIDGMWHEKLMIKKPEGLRNLEGIC